MPVVRFDKVSKAYTLGTGRTSLRELLVRQARRVLPGRKSASQLFWALKEVSFDVQAGEILGIIGHNGAGKSTALKLLSKVTYPTSGSLYTRGRTAALIELGAGFHPDLTGRENIFLNGSLLGLKKREIAAQLDEIVAFSGLEQFIDTPVKRYSSGMYVRLAFAVAAHVRSDLLLVDEVLSVGDSAFQQKCLDKMREMHTSGATILLVSHNLWMVQTFCSRAILLRRGQIEADGAPQETIDVYRTYEREDMLTAATGETDASLEGDSAAVIEAIELLDESGSPLDEIDFGRRMRVRVCYRSAQRIHSPLFVIRLRRSDGLMVSAFNNRQAPGFADSVVSGEGQVEVCIGPLPLVPDIYSVEALLVDSSLPLIYASRSGQIFRVRGALTNSADAGVLSLDVEWLQSEKER